jgi:HTH-type transcriptional repressor of NAD biosynthesis genes
MVNKTTGMVLGKFMPLHKGHELLLTFATHFVDTLYVVVDNVFDAPIAGALRCQWIQELYPLAEVFYIPSPLPQSPSEHSDFWNIWTKNLLALLPQKPDYLFASEHYGEPLARALGSIFIPFDKPRHLVPTSGTAIRQAPFAHWQYLSDGAKRYYLKRICLFGPESAGKTTLAQLLAKQYQTDWVPEYARSYLETNPVPKIADMEYIAKGQIALEKSITKAANKVLFCDTDPLSTVLWSRYLFSKCSDTVLDLAAKHACDFYLLMSPDLEWECDPVRYLPNQGRDFFNSCVELLTEYQRPFAVVSGKGDARLQCALRHIGAFISCLE